ncbi:CRISPR-associated endonuclease Cas1 [Halosquirtibacter laminarini]|uniref:CRISPR-associated endonuclease Cas1 n=1 Tax=Halosquirtibacter laminarini TaxID=3374600 RepID=A0AC61NP38_9BACT|nr:CRISPR-associated endonuclease Cas1 [Prolixibacteraceae bacterium]
MDLILNTYGTTLTKDLDSFVVVHPDGKQRVHPKGVKCITISKGAMITSDAAILAIENQIDVLFVDTKGSPVGRVWSHRYGSVSTIRRNQLDFTFSCKAVDWVKAIQQEKIGNQQALLLALTPTSSEMEAAVNGCVTKLEDYRSKISLLEGEVVSDIAASLRGWEGVASRAYWKTIQLFMPESMRYEARSQHPAMDLFNCLLNYGYGVLYGKVEGALIKAGIDPYVGMFHRDDYNRPVLVYDVIERFRIWVDFVVISLATQEAIPVEGYRIKEDGSVWLDALGKRILIQSLNDYFDEVITVAGVARSRMIHLHRFCEQLAQSFLQYNPER